MGLFQNFVFKVFLKKVTKRGVQILVAWMASEQVKAVGVDVDQTAMTAAIWTGLEALRQLIKTNNPSWSWI